MTINTVDFPKEVPSKTLLIDKLNLVICDNKDGEKYIFKPKERLVYESYTEITLKEIQEQCKSNYIKVISDDWNIGHIYEYNNYNNKKWYLVGKTVGYA